MRILWIGKAASVHFAGDEVYDRNLIRALRRVGHSVDVMSPPEVSRACEASRLLAGGVYYRTRFGDAAFLDAAATAATAADAVVCSWEPFDQIAFDLNCRVLPILHNITSTALPSMYPNSRLSRLLARRAARWERTAYGSDRFPAVAVLSQADAAYVGSLRPPASVVYAPPGMPPVEMLPEDARIAPDLLIGGTYGWRPKRRDLQRFAREASAARLGVTYAEDTAAVAAAGLQARPVADLAGAAALRFGLVTDRFVAGHKLKSTAYIAQGAVVLSCADVAGEFAGLPDADLFVRKMRHADDVAATIDAFMTMDPHATVARFRSFQVACARRFNWTDIASRIAAAVARK